MLIGITTGFAYEHNEHGTNSVSRINTSYGTAFEKLDIPCVLLPYATKPESVSQVLGNIKGVIFSGGTDIPPHYYGEEPVDEIDIIPEERLKSDILYLDVALEHNIPIVERKPLAQLLYHEVEINQPVPDQSYAAVAEVLAYVYQLQGKPLPDSSQSMETPSVLAAAMRCLAPMLLTCPSSHWDTTLAVTPQRLAMCSWVSPAVCRAWRRRCPRV